jgi:tripartite-type tricarboxylate transporter receptor subunit TctC
MFYQEACIMNTRGKKIALTALLLVFLFGITGFLFAGGTGEAKDFPAKKITYIVPFDPGGQSDVTAQYQRKPLQDLLGVDVIIKHMPGAGGAVAWSNLVKTEGDGYTISGNNVPHIIIQPLVRDDAGYETEELKPVYMFQTTPIGFAVAKDSEFNSLQELIDYAKKNPGTVTVSGSGTHSGHHLAVLNLQHLSGAEFTYIPATGAAPSVANFLGGHTMAIMANSNDLYSQQDKMKILAIGTEQRFKQLPDVPTFIEEGVEMTSGIDRGICAPPDTPDSIIKVLEEAFEKVCTDETFVSEMEKMAFQVHNIGAKEFAAYIEKKKKETIEVLKELGEI